ncbi:MAG: replication ATP-dependent helicase/nuclease Dna2 [Acidobacteriota bacterium]|jgi:predicted RecB family nuclease|nr:replication ATP-dependent helicase/nuclease Dna2 [Acidobacteriota bacterium]
MKAASRPPQKFRLTASNIAKYFSNKCDRNFRWNTVAGALRGKSGIGWNVPKKLRAHSRPGIALLMEAGNLFEGDQVQALIDELGKQAVLTADIERTEDGCKVKELPFSDFIAAFQSEPFPQFVTQLEVVLDEEQEARLLEQFGLDAARVTLGPARPDLLEVLPPVNDEGKLRLRIWDFKASQKARHDHYIQVAYYSFILDHAIREAGLTNVEVDLEFAVIRSRDENDPPFELRPYRLAVEDFLRNRAPLLFQTPAADAHFHVTDHCPMCEYMNHCRDEANASSDLSRIAYISSESKRRLKQSGITTHRELAVVEDPEHLANLQLLSHDLSLNLPRYVATSQALEDGRPRPLHSTTLLMPRYEDIRVVLCAEQDSVTQTCFALGFKTYEGWDEENSKVIGEEQVFIARKPNSEAHILLEFLSALNGLLRRVDAANREIASQSVEDVASVQEAASELAQAEEALAELKQRCPVLRKTNPQYETLLAERTVLQERAKQAQAALKQARKDAQWELRKQQRTLHFYVYDTIDLFILRSLIERHLFVEEPPELLAEITHLLRLFPPSSVMQDADTFRTMPGTIVTQVLRTMVALPTPYVFDLKTVSEMYQPQNTEGEDKGYVFHPRYGFGWEFSSQVAYERIHDVWNNESFQPDSREPDRRLSPDDVYEKIGDTVKNKLRATDSVIRRLKRDFREKLLLRKEPFMLYSEFDPLNFRTLEALRAFSILETSLAELAVKHIHALPAEERSKKFVCIRNLQYVPESEQSDGSLWFTFDPESRDVKFEVGDFNLVVTPEDQPEVLLGDVDGKLFESNWGRAAPFKMTLVEYDMQASPPRVRLLPENADKFKEHVDLTKPCALDQLYTDFSSRRILTVLRELQENPQNALHIHSLLHNGEMDDWQSVVSGDAGIERLFRNSINLSGKDPDALLNLGQWRAWRGVFSEPLTLIWGPPGTGKTHTVAHILLAYALAAQAAKKSLRILVTAFTHHAIVNVLRKLAELARGYNLAPDALSIVKLMGSGSAAHDELPPSVELLADEDLEICLQREALCVVAGATVWGAYKGMKKAGGIIRPWFDVVLVDEASQMRLPDALVAFGSSKPNSNIILAGDDQQLPPIIHGSYPEEHEHMLSSVFTFMRRQIEEASVDDPSVEARKIFQLEENFRMNEPLTAYPRHVLYRGRFRSTRPDIRIQTAPAIVETSEEIIDTILNPERPVVLCWYTSPRSFTARNPIEAELVALLTDRLSQVLLQEAGDKTFQPYSPRDFVRRGLAVLSPHRAQNSAIRQALHQRGFGYRNRPMPLVDTVEKMQGKEREVILVSYGVADEEYATAEAQFLLSRNRFNVAATRAERKLIVICSDTVLDAVPTDRRTLLEAMMLKEFRNYCSDGHVERTWMPSEGSEVTLNIQWKGF